MIGEATMGLSALKTAFDIAKGLKDLDSATTRNAAVIELQEKILTAQQAQSALLERVGELEKKVASFETWEAEKHRYELKDIGDGSLAYVIKESMRGTEPPHSICATCYQKHKKSILQPKQSGFDKLLTCHDCGSKLIVGHEYPSPVSVESDYDPHKW